jgi:selenide, water dikinase
VLSDIPAQTDDRVLVDFRTADDAGVFRWESGPALVQTVDFFTPIVDDPYVYGQIAAANALSDIYAMGGRPLTALAIAGFPKDGLEPGTIREIFRGGFDKLREAGVSLLGGHTVQDQEIKFGYAVTGAIDPARVLTNAGARAGDVLFLTKPLGTGIVGTAIKFDRAAPALVEEAVRSMRTLNRAAADALHSLPAGAVHACTDITGFGLAGHGTEMARASGVTLAIHLSRVPLFAGVDRIAFENQSGGLTSNQDYFESGVRPSIGLALGLESDDEVTPALAAAHAGSPDVDALPSAYFVLFDPQTSGGLLVSAAADAADRVEASFADRGVAAARIGAVVPAVSGVLIEVRP